MSQKNLEKYYEGYEFLDSQVDSPMGGEGYPKWLELEKFKTTSNEAYLATVGDFFRLAIFRIPNTKEGPFSIQMENRDWLHKHYYDNLSDAKKVALESAKRILKGALKDVEKLLNDLEDE